MWALAIVNTIFVLIPLITDLAAPDYTKQVFVKKQLNIVMFNFFQFAVVTAFNQDYVFFPSVLL